MHRSGFTLIEISIVIIVIGLVISGILVGQDLMRAASIRATISQVEKYKTAVHAFKAKYHCIPGDCKNAVSLGLGTSGGAGDNGNGDGYIIDAVGPLSVEGYNFWHHLSQAGLVAGSFTGYTAQTETLLDRDYPSIQRGDRGGIWVASPAGKAYGNAYNYMDGIPNSFWIAHVEGHNASIEHLEGVLSPLENYLIDSKTDDGYPLTGKVTLGLFDSNVWLWVTDTSGNFLNYGPGGATSNFCGAFDTTPPSYNVSNTTRTQNTLCVLEIRADF